MTFALIARDRPGALPVRQENRAAHLAYIRETGVVSLAGPLVDDEGGMIGSLIVLDVASRAEAEAWAAGDPYGRAGLFESVEIVGWKRLVG